MAQGDVRKRKPHIEVELSTRACANQTMVDHDPAFSMWVVRTPCRCPSACILSQIGLIVWDKPPRFISSLEHQASFKCNMEAGMKG